MTAGLNETFVASPDQLSCELSGEAVILNLGTGIYYGLNAVGARVWQLLQKPRTVGEVRDVLLSEFDVDKDCCERDLQELMSDLVSRKMVQAHEFVSEISTPQ